MTAGSGIWIVSLAAAAVAAAVASWLGWRARRGPSRSRPSWLGADPVAVEELLREALDERRWSARQPPLRSEPGLDELARHHAHGMSVAGETAERDEQGRDVQGRRADLSPELLGPVVEMRAAGQAASVDDPTCARALVEAIDSASWCEPRWTAGAVGVAVGHGRAWACVVLARRLAMLAGPPVTAEGGGLEIEGLLLEGAADARMFQRVRPDGSVTDLRCRIGEDRRFRLHLPAAAAAPQQVLLDGEVFFIW